MTSVPIEDGKVAQILVEYIGGKVGTVTYRRPSGRAYRFAAGGPDQCGYVLSEDEGLFRSLPEFRICEDERIDPEGDKGRFMKAEMLAMKAQLAEVQARQSDQRRRSPGPAKVPGRKRIPEADNALAWHLKQHCEWSLPKVAERFGMVGSAPAAAMRQRIKRWLKEKEPQPTQTTCRLCKDGDLPPPPE